MTAPAPAAWRPLVGKPAGFADGPAADAWFGRLAAALLNRASLRVGGRPHRLIEVEVYYHGPGHADPFAHQDPVQLHPGRWYFHRTRGEYRGGSFKGVDLSFGGGTTFAGVLFRGLEKPDGTLIDGPSLLVDYLLATSGYPTVAALDAAVGPRPAWDPAVPLGLELGDRTDRPVLRTARVGLSLKRRRWTPTDPAAGFLLRRYRYLSEPTRTAKGKPHMVLAMYADGEPAEAIRARTGCALPTIRRYAADFDAGATEADPAAYYGREWGTADLCRLHGLWHARGL